MKTFKTVLLISRNDFPKMTKKERKADVISWLNYLVSLK
jgi:hypothetical protein